MQIEILQAEENETKWENSRAFLFILLCFSYMFSVYLKDLVFKAKMITIYCEIVNIYRGKI